MRDAFRFPSRPAVPWLALGSLRSPLPGRRHADDPCLRDTDVECTTAGGFTQTLDLGGALTGVLAVRVLPVILAIAVAGEAVQWQRPTPPSAGPTISPAQEEPGS